MDVPGTLSGQPAACSLLVYGCRTSRVTVGRRRARSLAFIAPVRLVAFVVIGTIERPGMMPLISSQPQPLRRLRHDALHWHGHVFDVLLLTQSWRNVLGWSASGRRGLPMTLGIIFAAVLASTDDHRIGIRIPLLRRPRCRVMRTELTHAPHDPQWYGTIVLPLLIVSIGLGLSFVPRLDAVSESSHRGRSRFQPSSTHPTGGAAHSARDLSRPYPLTPSIEARRAS